MHYQNTKSQNIIPREEEWYICTKTQRHGGRGEDRASEELHRAQGDRTRARKVGKGKSK